MQTDVSATLATSQDQTLFVYRKSSRAQHAGEASTYVSAAVANTLNTWDIGDSRANEIVCMTDTQANTAIAVGGACSERLRGTMLKTSPWYACALLQMPVNLR